PGKFAAIRQSHGCRPAYPAFDAERWECGPSARAWSTCGPVTCHRLLVGLGVSRFGGVAGPTAPLRKPAAPLAAAPRRPSEDQELPGSAIGLIIASTLMGISAIVQRSQPCVYVARAAGRCGVPSGSLGSLALSGRDLRGERTCRLYLERMCGGH